MTVVRHKEHTLQVPLEHGGTTITKVTIRRPKARDMIVLGDHVDALTALAPKPGESPEEAAKNVKMGRSTFEAMLAVAATLADLGEAAGELDFSDLVEIATIGLNFMGEVKASAGKVPAGAQQ